MADTFINPVFNLFEPQLEDNSIESKEYIQFPTVNGLDTSNYTGSTFKIVTNDKEAKLVPSEGYLNFVFRVGSAAKTLTTNSTELHASVMALFSRAVYQMNRVDIDTVNEPGPVTQLTGLLNFAQDYLDKQGSLQWLYLDAAEPFDAANPRTTRLSVAGNLPKRVRCIVPLNRIFGFFNSMTSAFQGMEHTFEFTLEQAVEKVLFGQAAAPGAPATKLYIDEMSIWMPRVVASPFAESKYLGKLQSGDSTKVTYESWSGYRDNHVNPSNTTLTYQIQASSQRPKYIFIGFQKRSRSTSIYAANDVNPSVYDNLDLKNIRVRANTKPLPLEPYVINYADASALDAGDYVRPFKDFLRINGKDSEYDNGSLISYESYKSLYPIYAFDLSNEHSLFENIKNSTIYVDATFGAAGGDISSVNMVCWEKELKIEALSGVITIVRA
jgi:hypothetical protein